MNLYLWINIVWICVMLFLTFSAKFKFYKKWKALIPAIVLLEIVFMLWNIKYTHSGIWGFTTQHLSGVTFFEIPIEEWMLFFIFPYTCIFVLSYFSHRNPRPNPSRFYYIFALLFTFISIGGAIFFYDKSYTFTGLLIAGLLNWIIYFGYSPRWYGYFVNTFLTFYLVFFIINGVVSQYFAFGPIVWYNPKSIIGWKIMSIPIENIFFYFSLFMGVSVVYHFIDKRYFKMKKGM